MASIVFFETRQSLRTKLGKLLTSLPEITLAIPAGSGEQLLRVCQTMRWDVAIVDLLAPGQDALGLLATLRQECPTLPVIAVSFELERQVIQCCLDLGMRALIASEDLPDELEAAIHAALAGEIFLSRRVREVQKGSQD